VLAAVTRSPGELVVEDVGGPWRARPGHVIVRPEAVGICGSDFHLFSGEVAALSGASDFYPRVQGHEVAAIVEDPGDTSHDKGDRVAIWPLLPCGRCYPCRTGRPNVCPAFRFGAGPIGLAVLAAAVHAGAKTMSVDPVKTRRDSGGFPRRHKPGDGKPETHSPAFLAPFPAGPRGRGLRIRDEQAAGRGQDRGERERPR
jgi:threonine dehydrogenase-like Zn-dependent dehydrogenase